MVRNTIMVITAPRILPKAIPKIPLPDMPTSAELTKMWLDTAALIMGGVGGGSALHLLYHESREEQEKKIIAILEKTLEEKRLRGENAEMPITREQALKF